MIKDERNSLILRKFYCNICITIYKTNTEKVKHILINYSAVCIKLANLNIDVRENRETTIAIFRKLLKIFHRTSTDYGILLMNEGEIRILLAEANINMKRNLKIAINLFMNARKKLRGARLYYIQTLKFKSFARRRLAEMNVNKEQNLEAMIQLCKSIQRNYLDRSEYHARSLVYEGDARFNLAMIKIKSEENLEIAISLYQKARNILSNLSIYYADALIHEANAKLILVQMGIKDVVSLEESRLLYLEGISIYEKSSDFNYDFDYIIALWNFNILMKEKLYRTKEKTCLDRWKKKLDAIGKKLEYCNSIHKDSFRTSIHEMRASLLELEGKSEISKVYIEYYEANKISKDPFYEFMMEFCQERNNNKSFSDLKG